MAEKITIGAHGALNVPDEPIIPFIEGDGTGVDIWPAAKLVLDAAAAKHGKKISWLEVLAGEKAFNTTGEWLPDATVDAFREYLIGIKGPLTTPVGGGMRSLNVALRQLLDLYVCLRPVRYFAGVPSPVKRPEAVDMVIFRENTEDIYAGIEYVAGSDESAKLLGFIEANFPADFAKIRFGTKAQTDGWQDELAKVGAPRRDLPVEVGLGIKPVTRSGTERLVHAAIDYAVQRGRKSVTLVHKGNIMKYTEGAFRDWGYGVAKGHFGAVELDGGPWQVIPEGRPGAGIVIKDVIADAFLQQILTRPDEYDVVATLNLNGDYISDALAAEVGGIGIAPGANINYITGRGIFEATHGTAPKYAGQDKVNPGSLLLSGVLMFEHLGWTDEANDIVTALEKTISDKIVTYDFARMLDGAKLAKCSEFAQAIVDRL